MCCWPGSHGGKRAEVASVCEELEESRRVEESCTAGMGIF